MGILAASDEDHSCVYTFSTNRPISCSPISPSFDRFKVYLASERGLRHQVPPSPPMSHNGHTPSNLSPASAQSDDRGFTEYGSNHRDSSSNRDSTSSKISNYHFNSTGCELVDRNQLPPPSTSIGGGVQLPSLNSIFGSLPAAQLLEVPVETMTSLPFSSSLLGPPRLLSSSWEGSRPGSGLVLPDPARRPFLTPPQLSPQPHTIHYSAGYDVIRTSPIGSTPTFSGRLQSPPSRSGAGLQPAFRPVSPREIGVFQKSGGEQLYQQPSRDRPFDRPLVNLTSRAQNPDAQEQQQQQHHHHHHQTPEHAREVPGSHAMVSAPPRAVASGPSIPVEGMTLSKDGLGPKIWTGTQFLPRFVRAAEVSGEGLCYFYDDGSHCKTVIDGEAVNAHWGVTKAGKPRKRLAIACTTCREKKTKCDPDFPRCVQCEKAGRECHFKNAPRGGSNNTARSTSSPTYEQVPPYRQTPASRHADPVRSVEAPLSRASPPISPGSLLRPSSPEPIGNKRPRLGSDDNIHNHNHSEIDSSHHRGSLSSEGNPHLWSLESHDRPPPSRHDSHEPESDYGAHAPRRQALESSSTRRRWDDVMDVNRKPDGDERRTLQVSVLERDQGSGWTPLPLLLGSESEGRLRSGTLKRAYTPE